MTYIFLLSFVLLLISGMPITFVLGVSSLIYFRLVGIPFEAMAQFMAVTFDSFVLLAIPLFMLAGMLMNAGGITDKLFGFANVCVGHISGGLAQVNVLASMIFAGMSGSATADCAGLGQIEIKAMRDKGFDPDFSAAISAASACLGPIIPPSISMVIYGAITGVSIAALFAAGIIPGLLAGLGLMVMNYIISKKRRFPRCDIRASRKEIIQAFWKALPPLLTPVIILGGILTGVFTPTEAAGVASLYAFILGVFVYKKISFKQLLGIFYDVGKLSASVMVIVSTARVFGYVLTQQGIPQQMAHALISGLGNKYLILLVLNLFLLFLGCFLESTAIELMIIPLLSPILNGAGISLLHFGIVMAINMQVALITPPMGMSLFVVSKLANTAYERVVKAIIPFLIVLIIVLVLITYVPSIPLFLPNLIWG